MSSKQHSKTVPSTSSGDPSDDIPFALRDPLDSYPTPASGQLPRPPWWVIGLMSLVAVGTLGFTFWIFNLRPQELRSGGNSPTPSDPALSPQPGATPSEESLLGHRRYAEADPSQLVAIDDTGEHKLQEAAATAFLRMQDAAKADGVSLLPLSAYRSIKDQQYLFFDVKSIRGQDTSTRAEVSAPPGYSEHHTGYAVDIGDGTAPDSNLSGSFEDTEAFRWLQENASHYSFELSFLPNNDQGIAYEPWHWRYVGDQDSLETFYKGIPPASPSTLETPVEENGLASPSPDNTGENSSNEASEGSN